MEEAIGEKNIWQELKENFIKDFLFSFEEEYNKEVVEKLKGLYS